MVCRILKSNTPKLCMVRNLLNRLNFSQVDFSLSKFMRFYENANGEFKANFINAFNYPNFGFGDVTLITRTLAAATPPVARSARSISSWPSTSRSQGGSL